MQNNPDHAQKLLTTDINAAHRYSHHAMHTIFEIYIVQKDKSYAGQAALAAFRLVDQLEADISRFIDNSDISRLNTARAGVPVSVSLDTFYCLEACERLYRLTFGAFDITVGPLIACFFDKDKKPRTPSAGELARARQKTGFSNLVLDNENLTVTLKTAGVRLDLGGFGKGYAVDKMIAELGEWDIKNALVHGGASSVYARGAMAGHSGWPVSISEPQPPFKTLKTFDLSNIAFGASGIRKGRHIIDPRTAQPAAEKIAAWVLSPDAGDADALSTAFMILSHTEIVNCCTQGRDIRAIVLDGKKDNTYLVREYGFGNGVRP